MRVRTTHGVTPGDALADADLPIEVTVEDVTLYTLLLRATTLLDMPPVIAREWMAIFRQPWLSATQGYPL